MYYLKETFHGIFHIVGYHYNVSSAFVLTATNNKFLFMLRNKINQNGTSISALSLRQIIKIKGLDAVTL